jgi:hypothetical protein
MNSIEQYVCPFCLQADALFKVKDDGELIDGWGCHRCKTVQLRDAEYAEPWPPTVLPVRTQTTP